MVGIEVIFRGWLAGHRVSHAGAGGDDQGVVRACQGRAERLNGAPVSFADGDEVREVVVEGAMDDAVGLGGAAAQTVQVFQVAAMDLGAGGGESLSACVGAGQAQNLVTCLNELLHNGRADESGGAGDEYTHDDFSLVELLNLKRSVISRVPKSWSEAPSFVHPRRSAPGRVSIQMGGEEIRSILRVRTFFAIVRPGD